jgi:hypothetical protein
MWLLAHVHEGAVRLLPRCLTGDPTCQYGCFAFPEPPGALLLFRGARLAAGPALAFYTGLSRKPTAGPCSSLRRRFPACVTTPPF